MLEPLERHHHFRDELVRDYVSRVEARVVSELRGTAVPDSDRDSGIAWELKHQAGVTQCARILAARRGMDPDVAAVGAVLHDIYAIVSGSYEDHARRGGPIAEVMLSEAGGPSDERRDQILSMVVNHSDKHLTAADPWAELGKDVDILDCFLYAGAADEYLLTKPLVRNVAYFSRAKAVWRELGLPIQTIFRAFDHYQPQKWLSRSFSVSTASLDQLLASDLQGIGSPFAIQEEPLEEVKIFCAPEDESPIRALVSQSADLADASHAPHASLLVWPLLNRYQPLTQELSYELGIEEGSE